MSKTDSALKNIASEQAVLAGLLQHGKQSFIEVSLFVGEDSFTLDNHKILFRCIAHALSNKDVIGYTDLLSSAQSLQLNEYIEKNKTFKETSGSDFNIPIHIDNVLEHAKKLKRLEFARKIQSELRNIYTNLNQISGDESISDILSLAENPIQDICLSYMKEDDLSPQSIGNAIDDYISHLENNKGKSIGITTGFAAFDKAIGGGLRRKCVDLIAARPKEGKSCLADNVALYIGSTHKIPVLMLDTEMSKQDHINRLLANLSETEINQIASGSFFDDAEKKDKVLQGSNLLRDLPYDYISIAGRPFEETLSIAKRWLIKRVGYDENGVLNDCVIIYDYLKLMTSSSISNNLAEFQVLGFQITALHNFCVENDVPCLSFVQLNRDGITKETTDVVSGSDRLVWLCTSFSIFKSKTEEERITDGINYGNKKLIPVVSRHGPGIEDEGYICLQMDGKYARIRELGTIRSIKRNDSGGRQGFADSQDDDITNQDDEKDF
jgi:replicative DNA helicase